MLYGVVSHIILNFLNQNKSVYYSSHGFYLTINQFSPRLVDVVTYQSIRVS